MSNRFKKDDHSVSLPLRVGGLERQDILYSHGCVTVGRMARWNPRSIAQGGQRAFFAVLDDVGVDTKVVSSHDVGGETAINVHA